jgi:hypothetical protein
VLLGVAVVGMVLNRGGQTSTLAACFSV